jgi:hypothetical protein
MTARVCHDWSPLKYSADPIPGDPDQVEAAAKSYATTADSVNQVSDYLANLDGDGQRSDTITALMARSRELSGQLLSVSGRYSETAAALLYYAPELRAAQAMADSAISEGAPAESQRKQAANNAQDIYLGWMTTLDPNSAKEFEDSYNVAKQRASAAAYEVSLARNKVEEAIRRRDAAAEHAKSLIESAIVNSPMTDSVLDKFKEVLDKAADILTKVGKWIWDNIDTISLVLTVAAAVLAFIPGLDVIAPVLLALSKVATIIGRVKAAAGVVKSVTTAVKTGDWSGVVATGAAALAGWAVGKVGGAVAGKLASGAKSMAGQAVYAFNGKATTGVAGAFSKIVRGTAEAGLEATEAATSVVGSTATKKVTKVLTEFATADVSQETKRHITDYVGDKVEDYVNKKLIDPVKGVVTTAVYHSVDNAMDSYRVKTQTCGGAQ